MMADTRKNNQILKNQISQNQCDNSKDIIYQNKITKLEVSMDILKKQNEELKIKVEKLEKERDAETKKSLQLRTENISNRELILELRTSQSKLTSDLEICKSSDVDRMISDKELEECNEELEAEKRKNYQCESEKNVCQQEIVSKTKIISELRRGSARHIITKQELQDCEEELEDEIQKTRNLQTHNSILRSSSTANRKLAQECQYKLENEIEGKEILQEKYESVCPSWSEWSSCSETCRGTKTRTDRCSNSDEQLKSCNQFSSCPRSGK